jgi:hypothetical protein
MTLRLIRPPRELGQPTSYVVALAISPLNI